MVFSRKGIQNWRRPFFFDLREGIFSEEEPLHGDSLNSALSGQLLALLFLPLENCHEVNIARADRKVLLKKLLQFYQLHVPGFTGINTPEIMEMTFDL